MRMKNLLLAGLLIPGFALANDGVASVSVGGIVFRKTDAIAMKKEVLNVSRTRISVDYEFLNESGADVEETIVFPLPVYPADSDHSDTYYGQPHAFSIKVDGKPVTFTTTLDALQEGTSVIAKLRQAGLTDPQIAFNSAFHETKVTPRTATQDKQLTTLGLLGDGPSGDPHRPLWSVKVNYVWKQKFPANQVVKVHHAYRPFVDGGPAAMYLADDFSKKYCADKNFKASWAKMAAKNGVDYVQAEYVSYILKTGNTWKNGIEDFTLNVIKDDPENVISLCFPGTFKKIDAKTLQVHLTNFHPKQDLEIYFGNLRETEGGHNGLMPAHIRER